MSKFFITESERNYIRKMYNLLTEADEKYWYDNTTGELNLSSMDKMTGGAMLANRVFPSIPAGSPYPKKIKFEGGSPVKDNTGAVTVLIDASGTPTANNPKPADKAAPAAPAANNTGNQVSKQPSGYVQGTDTKDVVINGQKIMGLGSKGDLVKFVQHKMSKKYPDLAAGISKDTACSTDQTKCDGIFGKNTMAAVAKFQTEKNLQGRKNGVIGKITFPEIEKL